MKRVVGDNGESTMSEGYPALNPSATVILSWLMENEKTILKIVLSKQFANLEDCEGSPEN